MKLRSLLVVTGTVRIEGGDTTRQVLPPSDDGDETVIIRKKSVTDDRRRGNTIATTYMRDLRRILILRTPFGVLIDPKDGPAFDEILREVDRKVSTFNKSSKTCQLVNAVLRERLTGDRKLSIEGWITKQLKEKAPEVVEALPKLED